MKESEELLSYRTFRRPWKNLEFNCQEAGTVIYQQTTTFLASDDLVFTSQKIRPQFHLRSENKYFFSFGKIPLNNKNEKKVFHFIWKNNHPLYAFFLKAQNQTNQPWWGKFPLNFSYIPQTVVDYKEGKWTVTISSLEKLSIRQKMEILQAVAVHSSKRAAEEISSNKGEVSTSPNFEIWNDQVNYILDAIQSTKLKKAVLHRRKDYKLAFTEKKTWENWQKKLFTSPLYGDNQFFILTTQDEAFFGQTPEYLFLIQGEKFRTHALAGTRKRGASKIEDRALEEELWNSSKERNEHQLVLNELLNLLKLCLLDVQQGIPHILKLKRLQHINQEISGPIKEIPDINALIKLLHPTAAIGGYPRDQAKDVLQKCKEENRGPFSAPFGLILGNNIECYVGIRSAYYQKEKKQLSLFAGAGIVEGSCAESEWDETERKMNHLEHIIFSS